MNIYKVYYKSISKKFCWVFIKSETEEKAKEIFYTSTFNKIKIDSISRAYEHQIVRSDITLNFTIDFEKDYICG